MKKSLYIEYDFDFFVIGICSTLKEYRLCYYINKQINSQLFRSAQDASMSIDQKGGGSKIELSFPLYEYFNENQQQQWFLVSNKCSYLKKSQAGSDLFTDTQHMRKSIEYLIPEHKQIDYFLLVHDGITHQEKINLTGAIKKIPNIVTCYEIDINKIKTKENLVF